MNSIKVPALKRKVDMEKVVEKTMTSLCSDITALSNRKETAGNVFLSTQRSLEAINADLKKSVDRFDHLVRFAQDQKAQAERMISDNEKVCTKIREIVGANDEEEGE